MRERCFLAYPTRLPCRSPASLLPWNLINHKILPGPPVVRAVFANLLSMSPHKTHLRIHPHCRAAEPGPWKVHLSGSRCGLFPWGRGERSGAELGLPDLSPALHKAEVQKSQANIPRCYGKY